MKVTQTKTFLLYNAHILLHFNMTFVLGAAPCRRRYQEETLYNFRMRGD